MFFGIYEDHPKYLNVQNYNIYKTVHCIGEQFLNLRFRMTKSSRHLRTDSSLNRSELEMNSVRIFRKIFHPHCGLSDLRSDFLQRYHPFLGFPIYTNNHPYLYKQPSFRRKSFSLRLISSGGKMERMPMPVRWDWPWNAFNRSSHQEG